MVLVIAKRRSAIYASLHLSMLVKNKELSPIACICLCSFPVYLQFIWLYASDSGEWLQYDVDSCALLEREYLAQAPVCLLGTGKAARFKLMTTRRKNKAAGRSFVTFCTMQEINAATGMRREVRRVLPGQIASCKEQLCGSRFACVFVCT